MARSLVERLKKMRGLTAFMGCKKSAEAFNTAAEMAEPYEARREALERVLDAVKTYVKGECPGTAWTRIQIAIAAVPEIPEE